MNRPEFITVIIPVYNAEGTIKRTLISLEKQTCKNFKCIIVNDGSTDRTQQIIEDLLSELSFPVKIIQKENGGVISARYSAIEAVDTELVLDLDADDELTADAIEFIYSIWNQLSDDEQQKYVGIYGLSIDYTKKTICGRKFPKNINTCSRKKYMKYRVMGERVACTKTDCFRDKYALGVSLGETLQKEGSGKQVSEGVLHISIEINNRFYCVNKVLRIYHTEVPDSLCNSGLSLEKCKEAYFNHKYILEHFFPSEFMPFYIQFKSSLYLIKFGLLQNMSLRQIYRDLHTLQKKIVLTIALPFGIGNYILGEKITIYGH